jgi:thioesterase domain-containing protein
MTTEATRLLALEEYIFHEIPVTAKMGMKIVSHPASGLAIRGNLVENINHKSTAFGGSLNTFAIMACWCWIQQYLKNRDLGAQIVIQESHARFLNPVETDFVALPLIPDENTLARFNKMLERKGRARIALDSQITDVAGNVSVEFSGRFVALLN